MQQNGDQCDPIFNEKFTKKDLKLAISRLKNNKSSSFDMICNEMLKEGADVLADPLLLLFNSSRKGVISYT